MESLHSYYRTEKKMKQRSSSHELQCRVLTTHHFEMRVFLNFQAIFPYLNKHQLLTQTEVELLTIDPMLTDHDKVDRLLVFLCRKPDFISKLIYCLRASAEGTGHGHGELADTLEKAFRTMTHPRDTRIGPTLLGHPAPQSSPTTAALLYQLLSESTAGPKDKKFMGIAIEEALKSPDNNTKVGAVFVNDRDEVVALGHNDMPRDDLDLSWDRDNENIFETKYPYVMFADESAMLPPGKAPPDVRGCRLYTTLFPSVKSASLIIRSEIKEVVFLQDKYKDEQFTIASKDVLGRANIPFWKI